jgi:hypothetical protein
MTSSYRNYKGAKRRGTKKRRKAYAYMDTAARERHTRRMESRLVVCLFIAALFSIARLVLPGTFANVREEFKRYIGGSVDLKSAAAVIGEALNGEKSVSEAFSEAYGYAFGIERAEDRDQRDVIEVIEQSGSDAERV